MTAHHSRQAKLWDVASGKELLTIPGHNDVIICAEFSPDGRRLVTASEDFTVKIWDLDGPQIPAGKGAPKKKGTPKKDKPD